jgi:hypothetical protein
MVHANRLVKDGSNVCSHNVAQRLPLLDGRLADPIYDSYMAGDIRTTTNVAKVLRALLVSPTGQHYGYDLMRRTDLKSGNLYPILARLEAARWIEGHKDSISRAPRDVQRGGTTR